MPTYSTLFNVGVSPKTDTPYKVVCEKTAIIASHLQATACL